MRKDSETPKLTLIKILTERENVFLSFVRFVRSFLPEVELIILFKYQDPELDGELKELGVKTEKIEQNFPLDSIKKLAIEKGKGQKFFLLEKNEYLNLEVLLKIIFFEIPNPEFSYYVPVYFPSEIFASCVFRLKLFGPFANWEKIALFSESIYSNQKISAKLLSSYLQETAELTKIEKNQILLFSQANLFYLIGFTGKAIQEYKKLLAQPFSELVKINLYQACKQLDLIEQANKIVEADNLPKNSFFSDYLEFLVSESIEKKKNLCQKIFNGNYGKTKILNESELTKILFSVSFFMAENSERISEKIYFFRNAHFFQPENISISQQLFELIIQRNLKETPEISVIIPTFENFYFLEQTIKTLIINTDLPLEVIIIEDGGEISPKAEIFYEKNKKYLTVIRKKNNEGFIKAVNSGKKYAKAPYLLILNDDVIITPRSIDRLFENIRMNKIAGAIGPLQEDLLLEFFREMKEFNFNFPYPIYEEIKLDPLETQEMKIYDTLTDFYRLSLAMGKKNKTIPVNSLSGFCLLLPKTVLEKVCPDGLIFSEEYGFGYYEDFDLCEKIKRNGYQLLMVSGSVVQHYGSVTFSRRKKSRERINKKNKKLFFDRWFPGFYLAANNLPEISLCLVCGKESNSLLACLETIDDLCQEIIIANNGLAEKDLLIAQKFGATIIDCPEAEDSFAQKRYLEKASGKWILYLRAENYFAQEDLAKLKKMLEQKFAWEIISPNEVWENEEHLRFWFLTNEQK